MADAITVPATGNLIVTAAWNVDLIDGDFVECGLALDSTTPTAFFAVQTITSTAVTLDTVNDYLSIPGAVTGMFSGVAAGTHTVNLSCRSINRTGVDIGALTMSTTWVRGSL